MRNLVIVPSMTDKSSLSLRKYISDINTFKVLTHDEEYEVGVKAFNGDEIARGKLIQHNLRFVISVAKQYHRFGVGPKLEDLINEGNIGLIKASNNFDPSRGFKFISYAVWSIRQGIIAHIQDHSETIRKPSHQHVKSFKIKKEYAMLEQKLERKPSYNDLRESLRDSEFNEADINSFINTFNKKIKSLDAPLNNENGGGTLIDLMTDSNETQANIFVNSNDSVIRTDTLLKKLDDVEREVLSLLYGLYGKETMSIKEIANKLNINKSRISLIRDKSLRKLKFQLLHKGNWLKEI